MEAGGPMRFCALSIYFPLIVEEALMTEPTEQETADESCEALLGSRGRRRRCSRRCRRRR